MSSFGNDGVVPKPWDGCDNWKVTEGVTVTMNCWHGSKKLPKDFKFSLEYVVGAIVGLFELDPEDPKGINIICLQEWKFPAKDIVRCIKMIQEKTQREWDYVIKPEKDKTTHNAILFDTAVFSKLDYKLESEGMKQFYIEPSLKIEDRFVRVLLKDKATKNAFFMYSYHGVYKTNSSQAREKNLDFLEKCYEEHLTQNWRKGCETAQPSVTYPPAIIAGDWNFEHNEMHRHFSKNQEKKNWSSYKRKETKHACIWRPTIHACCTNARKNIDYFVAIDSWECCARDREDDVYRRTMIRMKDGKSVEARAHENLTEPNFFDHDPVFAEFEIHGWSDQNRNSKPIIPDECVHPGNKDILTEIVQCNKLVNHMFPFASIGNLEEKKFRLGVWKKMSAPKKKNNITDDSIFWDLQELIKFLQNSIDIKNDEENDDAKIARQTHWQTNFSKGNAEKVPSKEDLKKVKDKLKKYEKDNISETELIDLLDKVREEQQEEKEVATEASKNLLSNALREYSQDFSEFDIFCRLLWGKALELGHSTGPSGRYYRHVDPAHSPQLQDYVKKASSFALTEVFPSDLKAKANTIPKKDLRSIVLEIFGQNVLDIPHDGDSCLQKSVVEAVRECLMVNWKEHQTVWSQLSDEVLLIYCQLVFHRTRVQNEARPWDESPDRRSNLFSSGVDTPPPRPSNVRIPATDDSLELESKSLSRISSSENNIKPLKRDLFPSSELDRAIAALDELHTKMGLKRGQKRYVMNRVNMKKRLETPYIESVLRKYGLMQDFENFVEHSKRKSKFQHVSFLQDLIKNTKYGYRSDERTSPARMLLSWVRIGSKKESTQ